MSAAALLAMVYACSAAEMRYDHTLESAVKEIVASRIGDLRGGFSYTQKPQFVRSPHGMTTDRQPRRAGHEAAAGASDDALVPAAERPASRIVF